MVELRPGGRRPKQLGPPRRVQSVLPALVIALAGGWLLACSLGVDPGLAAGPGPARWNLLACGVTLLMVGASGWRWIREASWVAAGVGTWLLIAPAVMRYDQNDVFASTCTEVATSMVVMLAAERWASGIGADR